MINNLKNLRSKWETVLNVCKLLVDNISISPEFPEKRKRRSVLADKSREEINECPEQLWKRNVFYVILDNIIGNLTVRYKTANDINESFNFCRDLMHYMVYRELISNKK